MTIRIFLIRVGLFTLISLGTYLIGMILYGEFVPKEFQKNIFYRKFGYGFSNSRYKEVKQIKDVDILFLGSSRSYRHYDPQPFEREGYTTFNLGSSGQTFIQTEILLNRYLDSLNPEYVILDIFPGMFSSDGIEPSLDLISNDFNSWETFKMALKTKNVMVLNTWIFAVYKEMFFDSLDDIEPISRGKDEYVSGGFVKRDIVVNEKKVEEQKEWVFKEDQWESFLSVVQKINKTGTKLILIHSPMNRNIKYKGGEKFYEYVNSNSLIYLNYKELHFIDDSLHFYDPSHMNQLGVDLFNQFLLEQHF